MLHFLQLPAETPRLLTHHTQLFLPKNSLPLPRLDQRAHTHKNNVQGSPDPGDEAAGAAKCAAAPCQGTRGTRSHSINKNLWNCFGSKGEGGPSLLLLTCPDPHPLPAPKTSPQALPEGPNNPQTPPEGPTSPQILPQGPTSPQTPSQGLTSPQIPHRVLKPPHRVQTVPKDPLRGSHQPPNPLDLPWKQLPPRKGRTRSGYGKDHSQEQEFPAPRPAGSPSSGLPQQQHLVVRSSGATAGTERLWRRQRHDPGERWEKSSSRSRPIPPDHP